MAGRLKEVSAFVHLSGVTFAEALQLWPSIFQHDDVELAAVRVRSPIPRHDDALDVWGGKEMLVCVRLAVRGFHVLVKKELGEHARRLI